MILALVMAVTLGTEQPLDDPRQEARAQALMREIRCVVCENEPVSQSTADIAVDMRRAIRAQVEAGASDTDVRRYFSERYSDFVLFRPPATGIGLLLWVFPFLLLAGAGGAILVRLFNKRRRDLPPLPEEDA